MSGKAILRADGLTAVALVDGELSGRAELRAILHACPHFWCAGEYASSEDALEGLPNSGAQVVMLGLTLQGRNNAQACLREIKQRCPEKRIVIVATQADEATLQESLAGGADGFLSKPLNCDECIRAMLLCLAGGLALGKDARALLGCRNPACPNHDSGLTELDNRIMAALAKGALYKEIAAQLDLSVPNVRKHLHGIFMKYQVHNKIEALRRWSMAAKLRTALLVPLLDLVGVT